jgi:heme o synthase
MEASRATTTAAPFELSQVLADYVTLTKPKVQLLLLLTTVTTMYVAGDPSVSLVLLTLLGGSLSAGGAAAVNHYWDRDIDAQMARTATRPIPAGRISPRAALAYGLILQLLSFALLATTVNVLAAVLALSGFLGYVFVYTIWLKRSSTHNIVIGGAAGAVPVLVGWSAVTDSLAWAPFVLFAVVFFWTPPHYWPLSMKFKDDYAAAHVPMLPVVERFVVVARQVVAYSWAMVAASLLLVPVAPMGLVYLVGAVVAGALFVTEAHRLLRAAKAGAGAAVLRPMRLFHFSITYLTILFVAVAIDPLLYLPIWR